MRLRLVVVSILIASLIASAAIETRDVFAQEEPQELERFQGYLDPAPLGMDVRYAWTLPGGRGRNVRIIDIEYNWNLSHNDLVAVTANLLVYVPGVDPSPQFNVDHGTAVLGELVAAPDGIGVTGIAHQARLGLINPISPGSVPDVAAAIRTAVSYLEPGDVILLEQQSPNGPRYDPFTGRGALPIEFQSDVFSAIREATSNGIVVVESAGNGFESLDHPAYAGVFDRKKRDSGALIVGAGWPEGGIYGSMTDRSRTPESNFGSRVDLQGWGRFVTTCGYGQLRREQGPDNWYTIDFGATSGAAAMVAGAAAILQSIRKERGGPPLTSVQMRALLVSTGSPQRGNLAERIGPRPNLRAAIEQLEAPAPDPAIDKIKLKSSGKLVVDGSGFVVHDSVIEINGASIAKTKYPSEFVIENGTTTRVTSKGDIRGLLPAGVEVAITVFTPGSQKRSEPFLFTRD